MIERNGLPHRIYFSGTPRNVVIDGAVHELKFGESKVGLLLDFISYLINVNELL